MLFTKNIELLQDSQHPCEHDEETNDVHDGLYERHCNLGALDIAVADLLPFLGLRRRGILCDLTNHGGSLKYDGHDT